MNEPIRVLMLFTIMNRGGAESMVMNYYRHIDRTKVQFDFMVHRQERGAYDDEIEALGGKIYRMLPLRPPFIAYKKQIKQFFDEHPEYQIIHGHCSESGYFVYKEATKRGVPHIIAHAHNSHALFDLRWFFRTWFKHQMRPYITQGFTCGNDAAKWLFGNELAKKVIFQRNAIETSNYSFNTEVRIQKRKELGIDNHSFVVGHIGRFEKQKNHSFIIDIFERIVAKRSDSKLLLIGGTGDLMDGIKQKVHDLSLDEKVIFAGNRSDVPQLLQTMDVFLFPSFMEGMSLSMMEAQCAGLPLIASDTIPHEIAITDLISFLPLSDSPDFWAEKVVSCEFHPERRKEYPQQIVEAGYDIQQNAEWLQNYYLSLVR